MREQIKWKNEVDDEACDDCLEGLELHKPPKSHSQPASQPATYDRWSRSIKRLLSLVTQWGSIFQGQSDAQHRSSHHDRIKRKSDGVKDAASSTYVLLALRAPPNRLARLGRLLSQLCNLGCA